MTETGNDRSRYALDHDARSEAMECDALNQDENHEFAIAHRREW